MAPKRNQKQNQKMSWSKWKWKHSYAKLMECVKGILREKFITVNSYIKKKKNTINNLKETEKEETKPKVSIKKGIIKTRAEIKQRLGQ